MLPTLVVAGSTRADAQTKTFVTHAGANVVSVVDSNDPTGAPTSIDGVPAAAIVMTSDGALAYVADPSSSVVSVIKTANNEVVETLSVGAGPSALAVSPNGRLLYVMTAAGVVQVVDVAADSEQLGTVIAEIPIGATGALAITRDGDHLYVAAGLVYAVNVIDLAHPLVHSFPAETASFADIANTAVTVAASPNRNEVYVGVMTFNLTGGNFSATGGLAVVDTDSESVVDAVGVGSIPGTIALTPDGSRAYVGILAIWVNTGYGMGFIPAVWVAVVDTISRTTEAWIDLSVAGAADANQGLWNTASGIGVTPNQREILISVPRLSAVVVADVNTNAVSRTIPLAAQPGALAIVPDNTVAREPYVSDAVDDGAKLTTVGGVAVANVLDNDLTGGIQAKSKRVTLMALSSTSDALTLDTASGAVNGAAGIAVGVQALAYRICDIATLSSCDDATVTVSVRAPYVIDAVNDTAASFPGRYVLASVLANDTLNGAPITSATATLSVVSTTSPGIELNTWSGAVFVLVGTPPGRQKLTYRVCEIESPTNCDDADVTIDVKAFPINAVDDALAAPRSGGVAGSVLANDTLADALATLASVTVSQLSSTNAGVSLNPATGVVSVAAGTAVGAYSLAYRICETATPSNCDDAKVVVTVQPLQITAIGDSGRGSSKSANTVIANVLANDSLGYARATPANVTLSLVSISPVNKSITLDTRDGSIDVLGKAVSGLFQVVYQICEIAMPVNCARATASVDLSGGGSK